MTNTINNWVQICNNFVRKVGENVFDVIRLVDADEYTYYETYDKVDLERVSKNTFSSYGNYDEYLAEKTNEGKAVYTAIFGLSYDSSYTFDNDEAITTFLLDDGVIPEGETFKMAI